MRDLGLKVISGGFGAAFDTNGAQSAERIVPYACELIGVVYNISASVTLAHTANIILRTFDLDEDFEFPAGVTQGYATPTGRVFLKAGDRFRIQSNGENAADAYDITLAYILKPLSTRPVGEVWLPGASFTDIDSPGTFTQPVTIPFACQLLDVAFSMAEATDGEILVDVNTNGADSGVNIVIPSGTSKITVLPETTMHLKLGANISLTSDGGGNTGGSTRVAYSLRPEDNSIPASWVYMEFVFNIAFHTADLEFEDIVAPCHGRIRNLVTHWTAPIDTTPDTGNTFALLVNGSAPDGDPIYRNVEDTRDETGVSVPIENMHHVYVRQGDLITVKTNGEQNSGASGSTAGIWIEPMGQAAFGGV